jgi:hypothetical protein
MAHHQASSLSLSLSPFLFLFLSFILFLILSHSLSLSFSLPLSLAICSDTMCAVWIRSEVGALDARAAAASALCNLSRYGGLAALVHAVAEGGQEIKTEAASAMAKIADEDSEKDVIVATGVVDSLLEMIILSSTPRARLMAGRVLAKVSEPGSVSEVKNACTTHAMLIS